jgi:hypothetical protein
MHEVPESTERDDLGVIPREYAHPAGVLDDHAEVLGAVWKRTDSHINPIWGRDLIRNEDVEYRQRQERNQAAPTRFAFEPTGTLICLCMIHSLGTPQWCPENSIPLLDQFFVLASNYSPIVGL